IGSNPIQAMSILGSYLTANPSTRAIFALGPLGYTPAGKLLEKTHRVGKVALAGFDIDPAGLQLIEKGVLGFSLDAQPYLQAYMAINQLYLKAHYGVTPVDLNTG